MSYFDSKRIVGTNADRVGSDAISGGWVELGRTTLGSAATSITVSSLPDKRYYKVLTHITGQSANSDLGLRLNSDTGSNYARRFSTNGGSDISGTVTSLPWHYTDSSKTTPIFAMGYLANKSDKEKLTISHGVRQTGTTAGAPSRFESVGKWANTSNPIDEIQVLATGGTNLNSGSEMVVLGWDPDDTHTSNFWEELASVELGTTSSNISTGTISAKKYLWVQGYFIKSSASAEVTIQYNNDTGSNYARRKSTNGGGDGTELSQTKIDVVGGDANPSFTNTFIINNASNEKLGITHTINQLSAGAGNVPQRAENVTKWANTSNQITEIDFNSISSSFEAGSFIKVWGSN